MTEVKSGPAFSKVAGSQLVAVMRRNRDLAADYANRHNVPRFYDNAPALINDPEVNAVYIATPPGSHKEYAIQTIRAGKPAYIEKPMALNYSECKAINDEAQKAGVPVFVAYYRRALPGFVKVKELLQEGAIGKVRHVKIELYKAPSKEELSGNLPWRVFPEISGGGHFFDLASHQLDYLDFLFGPVTRTESVVLNQAGLYRAEDYISSSLQFENGVAGTGIWCFSGYNGNDRDILEFTGDRGCIKFSTFTFEPIVLENDNGKKEIINERPEHVQFYLIRKIVEALSGKGASPSTGVSGARTSRVMDEIVKEYYK